jgi:hypothetical protein
MDEFARQIGWIVIVIGVLYAIGRFRAFLDRDRKEAAERMSETSSIVRRLGYRKMYRSTTDPAIHRQIKEQYPWALLDLDLNDEQFTQKMISSRERAAFYRAEKEIEEQGHFCQVIDGKIRFRSEQTGGHNDA